MADAAVLKTAGVTPVRVRLPLPAPNRNPHNHHNISLLAAYSTAYLPNTGLLLLALLFPH